MDLIVLITRHVVNSLTEKDTAAVLIHTLCAVRTTSIAALLDIGKTTSQLSCYLNLLFHHSSMTCLQCNQIYNTLGSNYLY